MLSSSALHLSLVQLRHHGSALYEHRTALNLLRQLQPFPSISILTSIPRPVGLLHLAQTQTYQMSSSKAANSASGEIAPKPSEGNPFQTKYDAEAPPRCEMCDVDLPDMAARKAQ
jgi:hypothetical protein